MTTESEKPDESTGLGGRVDSVVMCEFLAQFKLLDSFACEHRNLVNIEYLGEAIRRGFVKNWKPKKGCTYYGTAICTPKGRLYLKQNT